MRSYTITPLHTATPAWAEMPRLEVDQILWLPDAGVRMEQQMCYNAEYLYVRQRAWEKNLRAEHRGQLQQVCEDSCMEFFFAPAQDRRYFNLEINPNGSVRLGFGSAEGLRTLLIPRGLEQLFDIHVAFPEDGWELTYRIPLSFIQIFYPEFRYECGTVLRGNCYKCGDLTDHPHYLSWNAINSETPNFHRCDDFGLFFFG